MSTVYPGGSGIVKHRISRRVNCGSEQEFIDGLYARVDALRGETETAVTDALAQGNTPMQARLERDVLRRRAAPGCSPR